MSSQCKLLLLGIDSATWRVLDPLLQAGKLPNIERLISRGTSGILRSLEYSASPVAWTTVATGKWPPKHGIQDFCTPQRHLKTNRIWEILAGQGETVGVYHFLVTWPPRALRGFIIPGWLAVDDTTHPPELRFMKAFKSAERAGTNRREDYLSYALQALRYGVRPSTLIRAVGYLLQRRGAWYDLDHRYRAQQVDIALNTDFFCHLLQHYQPTFGTIVFYPPDVVGHFYWKYMEPELFPRVDANAAARYGNVIQDIYHTVDVAVGKILRTVGDECTVFVASDHGMGPATHTSTYLYRPKLADFLEKSGFVTDRSHATIGLDFCLNLLDQPPDTGPLEWLLALLNGMTIVETGEQVFDAQSMPEQYVVIRVEAARPDLKDATIRLPTGETYPYVELVNTTEDTSGTHEPEGIIIAAGPGIKASHAIHHASLVDLVPTMLALLGVPVARDMDGEVLVDAIEESFLRAHPVTYVDSYEADADLGATGEPVGLTAEEREIIEERLRSLGYLS